ncbi:MAG: YggT family protein [Rhodospirillaceae bacterium]
MDDPGWRYYLPQHLLFPDTEDPMDVLISSIAQIVLIAIQFYIYLLIGQAILSWLVNFNVVNTSNRVVYMIGDFLYRITEPALRPIRRIMPDLGSIDISPVILIFALILAQMLIRGWFL